MSDAAPAGGPSATATGHEHVRPRCACDEQSMNLIPWLLAAAVVALGVGWLRRWRKRGVR